MNLSGVVSTVYRIEYTSKFNTPSFWTPLCTVASAMKSHVQTWFRCVAAGGKPVETPRRTTLRLVGGTHNPAAHAIADCGLPLPTSNTSPSGPDR